MKFEGFQKGYNYAVVKYSYIDYRFDTEYFVSFHFVLTGESVKFDYIIIQCYNIYDGCLLDSEKLGVGGMARSLLPYLEDAERRVVG